jgi:hypothetical protein
MVQSYKKEMKQRKKVVRVVGVIVKKLYLCKRNPTNKTKRYEKTVLSHRVTAGRSKRYGTRSED